MTNKDDKFLRYRKYIGYVIKNRRKKRNISQERLAEELEMNVSTVSRYESAKIEIPASCLEKISEVCNFEPKEYFSCNKTPERLLSEIADILGYTTLEVKELTESNEVNIDLIDELEHVKWLAGKSIDYGININIPKLVGDILIEFTPQKRNRDYLMQYWNALCNK